MEIYIPDDLRPFEPELRYFFDTMVKKLQLNRHKGFIDGVNPEQLVMGCRSELREAIEAIKTKDQLAVLVEGADVANMAFLLSLSVVKMTRREYEEYRKTFTGAGL